jgi:hypothetical protein
MPWALVGLGVPSCSWLVWLAAFGTRSLTFAWLGGFAVLGRCHLLSSVLSCASCVPRLVLGLAVFVLVPLAAGLARRRAVAFGFRVSVGA